MITRSTFLCAAYTVACGVLIFTQTGCLTVSMWAQASATDLQGTNVTAVPPAQGVAGDPQLIATYELTSSFRFLDRKPYFVRVPTDGAGRIQWPLGVSGEPATASEIVAAVSAQQAQALRTFRFTAADRRAAKALRHAEQQPTDSYAQYALRIDSLDSFAYGVNATGRLVAVLPERAANSEGPARPASFPKGARIFLIPNRQQRPPVEHTAGVVFATACTPITLAVDILFIPVALIYVATNGMPC